MENQPFHQAAKEGNAQLLRRASKKELGRGDSDGWTPLHWAAWSGNAEGLRAILNKGTDANLCNSNGSTPLHVAAQCGHMDALQDLIENGANVWALDDQGRTAARVAMTCQKLEAAHYLDTQASYWEAKNADGATKLKVKAMEQLEKRTSVKKANGKSYSHTTLPSIKENISKPSETNKTLPSKKKMSAEEAVRQNFELRPPGLDKTVEPKKEEEEHSDESLFNIIPKTQTAILLNTLHAIAPASQTHVKQLTTAPNAGHNPQLEGDLVLTNQVTQNDSTLATFLHSLDLLDCIETLHNEKMDLNTLSICEEKDLIGIGMALGPRKKILQAIQKRKEVVDNPGDMIDTDL